MGGARGWLLWGVLSVVNPAIVQAGKGVDVAADAGVDGVLTAALNDHLRRIRKYEGQEALVTGSAHLDLRNCLVTADIAVGFVPRYNNADFDDQLQRLHETLTSVASHAGCRGNATFRFGGRDIDYYFPGDSIKAKGAPRAGLQSSGVSVLSAGHGAYYRHGSPGRWTLQRDETNGIIEDDVTPAYASELQGLMEHRAGRRVVRARSLDATEHDESGFAWSRMAARYNLEAQLPGNPEIWHSLPGSQEADRERNEDIRSRPLYANHVGADEVIHLHTNAADSPAARGTRVFYHEDKPEDAPLAAQVLCYMRELITGQPGYQDFPVSPVPGSGRHGENRLANMTSVIVEAAFHTNAEDAAALKDPVFRTAAMKGVEKGVRLHRAGTGCEPLAVSQLGWLTLRAGERREVALEWQGHPRYPVVIITRNVKCPPGWKCSDGRRVLGHASTPAQITLACENKGSAPIHWETQMIDDDGARSPPMRHSLQCLRRPGA